MIYFDKIKYLISKKYSRQRIAKNKFKNLQNYNTKYFIYKNIL